MSQANSKIASPTEGSVRSEQKRRVAHLHSTLGVYGAERWTLALLNHLDNQVFESVVISVGTKPGADAFCRLALAEGFSGFHIPIPGRLNPRAIVHLRRLLLRERIDILHTHGFKADVLGYLATRGLFIRLVSTIHGWTASEGVKIRLYEALSRAFLRHFDRIYPLSPALLQHLLRKRFDPARLRLILNAVDLSQFEFSFKSRKATDPFSLLYVGRICRPKGVFDLIEAFAKARFSTSVQLSIAGDGPDREEAEALARSLGIGDKIKFLGQVSSIAPLLNRHNALALPSYSEGLPRVVMEAFAAGTPVVGTAIPGIKQLVENEITGILVPVADPDSLSHGLQRLLDNPDMARSIAVNARRLVVDKYSATRMAEDFREEYEALC